MHQVGGLFAEQILIEDLACHRCRCLRSAVAMLDHHHQGDARRFRRCEGNEQRAIAVFLRRIQITAGGATGAVDALRGAGFASDLIRRIQAHGTAGAAGAMHHRHHAFAHRGQMLRILDHGRQGRRQRRRHHRRIETALGGAQQMRTMPDAIAGQRRQCAGELDWCHHPIALADAGNHRFAGIPGLAVTGLFPFARWQHAAGFAIQIDATGLTETELRHVGAAAIDAEINRQLVVVGVDRLRQGFAQIDTTMTAGTPIAIALGLSGQMKAAGRQHRVCWRAQAELQPGERVERLDRRAGFIATTEGAIELRLMRRRHQGRIGLARNAIDERVRIKAGLADHAQHFAIARIDGDGDTSAAFEGGDRCALQLGIDAQIQMLSGLRRHPSEHAQRAPFGIGLDALVADLAEQDVFVITLDAGLADMRGGAVARIIEPLAILGTDAADIADDMAEIGAHRVKPFEIGHHFDTGKTVAIDREAGDFVFAQMKAQRQTLKAPLGLAQRIEALAVLGIDWQDGGHRVDDLHDIAGLLGHHFEAVLKHVLGEQHAIAVIDQATAWRQWSRLDAIGLGARVQFIVTQHLQPDIAANQDADEHEDDQKPMGGAGAERLCLDQHILDQSLLGPESTS